MQDGVGASRKHRIALVCDFFYPRLGGVEMHIWSLSQNLIRLGHTVVIVTHSYDNRRGVRYMSGPLKVYYCPIVPMVDQVAMPTFTATLPLLRWIFRRERINVVHGHQATSVLANESMVYGAALGLATVYTDHSLFGFNDVASVILNRVLQTTLSNVDAAICVSHTCRDNLILRTHLPPQRVHVIPNAIDHTQLTPRTKQEEEEEELQLQQQEEEQRIKVVVVSRLVYRKGVDLLVGIIPQICHTTPEVDFIIGGDGSKRHVLEEMVEREGLEDRVEFLGYVPHHQVRHVLCRGHIFLNCSLTESFCIAILEAASCGLLPVSTDVGGVPEILPPDMMLLAQPHVPSMVQQLRRAIHQHQQQQRPRDPWVFHNRVRTMYSWEKVAKETVRVYDDVVWNQPRRTLGEQLGGFQSLGGMAGIVAVLLRLIFQVVLTVVEFCQPIDSIDTVHDIS